MPSLTQISIGVALACVGVYIGASLLRKEHPDVGKMTNVFLAGGGVPSGCWLIYCAFKPAALMSTPGFEPYIAIGGLAVLVVSVYNVVTLCFRKTQQKTLATKESASQALVSEKEE